VSKLRQLLSYLERKDVQEVVFKTGAPATLSTSSRDVPVTITPLRLEQIQRFFADTPVTALLPSRDAPDTQHLLNLHGVTYRVGIGQQGGNLRIAVGVPGGVDGTTEVPRATPTPDKPKDPIPRRKHDSTSTRAALGRASLHRGTGSFRRADTGPVETVRSPSSGRREDFAAGRRARSAPGAEGGVTVGSVRRTSGSPQASSSAPASQRAMDARLEQGFGRDTTGPGRAPPSMEVLGAGLERDLEAGEPGRPLELDMEDSAPLLAPDLPPIERNEVTFEGDGVGIEIGSIEIESNQFESSERAAMASVTTPPSFESTSLDEPPMHPPAVQAPEPKPTPRRPAAQARAKAPRARTPTYAELDPRPSLAQTRDWKPRDVSPNLLQLLSQARRRNATDVHVVAEAPPRVRVAGALDPVGPALPASEVESALLPLLHDTHSRRLAEVGYVDFAIDLPQAGRLRVNINRQRTGLKACFRLLSDGPQPMRDLGLPPEVSKLLNFHQGLVMISGPNGHGKTATMAAIVDAFNASKPIHILTVEDPVEIIHPRKNAIVTQREVGRHTRSFQAALAASLREDPDVIAIGELRDRETVEMALAAAETGHLVFATMSTPSAAKTIDRLIDMFPPDDQSQVRATLAGALKLVLSQRLVRRRSGGMVAAFEMITGNVPLWSLIRDNKLFQLPSLLQRGRNFGMLRLDESLRELVQAGVIDREEALRHADDPRVIEGGGR
jgi:twitching motility protein PilT